MNTHYDKDARAILNEFRRNMSEAEYMDAMWSQRYPTAFPKAGNGWPYKKSAGVEETPKLRKVK
jgi:Fe-S oxidoreductase